MSSIKTKIREIVENEVQEILDDDRDVKYVHSYNHITFFF
jgi:hypothetical protein